MSGLPPNLTNRIFGLNVIAWGCIGFFSAFQVGELGIVRICVTLLNLLVGILITIRTYQFSSLRVNTRSHWLPAILCSGFIFKQSVPLHTWATFAEVLFVIGTSIALLSFLFLGKEFSIRPSFRNIIRRGPYQVVRHPAYFGEMLMSLACVLARPSLWMGIAFLLLLIFQAARILDEERILSQSEVYGNYTKSTKWRLIPFIW